MNPAKSYSIRWNEIRLFLLITFAVDWGIIAVYYGLGYRLVDRVIFGIVASLFMVIPAIVAFILQKYVYNLPLREIAGPTWRPNLWWLAGWLPIPFIALASMYINLLFPGFHFTTTQSGLMETVAKSLTQEQLQEFQKVFENPVNAIGISLAQALGAGLTINALFGFGEELGWRGFLHDRLKPLGALKGSLLIGAIWGIWHAPVILMGYNFPDHPTAGVFVMTAATMAMSPFFWVIREKGQSTIAPAITHGTFNASYGLSIIFIDKTNDLLSGSLGLSGILAFCLVSTVSLLYYYGKSTEKGAE